MAQITEAAIKTPGVYVNEIPLFPPSVAQVETAIPAFIGHTQKAENELGESLTNKPTKIFSLKEYEQYFGGPENQSDIKVTVNQKVEGTTVTLLSAVAELPADKVSKYKMYYSLRLYFANGGGPCFIVSAAASTANITTTTLEAGLNALATSDEPTIIVIPDGLSLAKDKYYELMGKAIDQCWLLQDRFTLVDVHTEGTNVTNTVSGFRTDFTKNEYLNYAAVYYPYLKTTFEYAYVDSAVNVVVVTNDTPAAAVKLNTLKTEQTAIYNLCIDTIGNKLSPTLAPSAAMAGIYARVDGSRGVWKAPANVSVNSVYGLSANISDAEQGGMNIDATTGKSVNAIRSFQGKGFLVWGARTLAGNDNEWRYVNVRRLFITVEESAKKATMQFVFEPNDANTWVKLRAMLENYLTLLWRQGALAGSKPEHAFYVRCGLNQTMTAQDILEGRLIVEIGMAAVRPAEFIILRFSHKMQES